MAENPRIEELRRRVQADPASIVFAALAEEFRRVGRYDDAVETCRTGLLRHPAYLSARVTLGRALIETGDFDAAREELETVLRSAPENLAAIRGLAQIHERLGHSVEMDPHLADLMKKMHEESILAASLAPPEPPPAPPEPEPSFAAESSFAPEPSFAAEPFFAPEPPTSLAPEPANPMAPQREVESVSLDAALSGLSAVSMAPAPPRAAESLDAAPGFPLDEAPEPPATDPFAAFAPMSSPAPMHDLSFDLATAFTIQPKAAPPAEPAVNRVRPSIAEPAVEIPEAPLSPPVFEAVPTAAPEADFGRELEGEPEPEAEPVQQMTAGSGPDPAMLATLARLERFLGAIESLRA